jgi:hypothetical protein
MDNIARLSQAAFPREETMVKNAPPPQDGAGVPLSDCFLACDPGTTQKLGISAGSGSIPSVKLVAGVEPDEKPSSFLISLVSRDEESLAMGSAGDPQQLNDSLKALVQEAGSKQVSEEILKTTAHLSSLFSQRASQQLPGTVRARESQEQDLAWAAGCAALVDFWWSNGQIEVLKDGAPAGFGTLDLKAHLLSRRPLVQGSTVEIETPVRYPMAKKNLAAQMMKLLDPYSDAKKDGEVEKLGKLYESDPVLAGELMQIIVGTAAESAGLSAMDPEKPEWNIMGVSRLLLHAKDKPWLRDLMKDSFPALADLPRRAHCLGRLGTNKFWGGDYVDYVRNLTRVFPDALNAPFLNTSLTPLLGSDQEIKTGPAASLAKELFTTRPDLIGPLLAPLLKEPMGAALDESQWSLLDSAAEKHGWMPEKMELDTICARLGQSPVERARSLFDNNGMKCTDFGEGIKFLSIIKKKNPTMLEGIELPDARGIPVPAEKALLERILQDPGDPADVLRALYTGGGIDFDRGKRMAAFYRIISDRQGIKNEMLDSLRKGMAAGGSIDGMNAAEQRTLIMLLSLGLKDPEQAELREILLPARLQRQYFYSFNSTMDVIRKEEIQKGLEEINGGIPGTPALFEKSRELLCMDHCLWFSPDTKGAVESILPLLRERMKTDPRGARQVIDGYFDELRGSLARHRDLAAMPERELIVLKMLEYLSRSDGNLDNSLYEVVKPLLTVNHGNCFGVETLLDPFREREIRRNLKMLGEKPLTRSERLEIVEANDGMVAGSKAFNGQEIRASTLNALSDGIRRAPAGMSLGEMPDFFSDPERTLEAYGHLEHADSDDTCSREWSRLRDILQKVGGETHFELALQIYHYVEEAARAGNDREKALAHALRCAVIDADPRVTPVGDDRASSPSGIVEQNGDFIEIGGMKLEVNKQAP